jgi:hypothetical protein
MFGVDAGVEEGAVNAPATTGHPNDVHPIKLPNPVEFPFIIQGRTEIARHKPLRPHTSSIQFGNGHIAPFPNLIGQQADQILIVDVLLAVGQGDEAVIDVL